MKKPSKKNILQKDETQQKATDLGKTNENFKGPTTRKIYHKIYSPQTETNNTRRESETKPNCHKIAQPIIISTWQMY